MRRDEPGPAEKRMQEALSALNREISGLDPLSALEVLQNRAPFVFERELTPDEKDSLLKAALLSLPDEKREQVLNILRMFG